MAWQVPTRNCSCLHTGKEHLNGRFHRVTCCPLAPCPLGLDLGLYRKLLRTCRQQLVIS